MPKWLIKLWIALALKRKNNLSVNLVLQEQSNEPSALLIAPIFSQNYFKVVINLKTADISSAIIGLLLSAYVWVVSASFPKDIVMKIGPDFFPRIIAGALALASIALLVQALTGKSSEEAAPIKLTDPGIIRAIAFLVLATVYVSIMDFLGFIIATVICLLTAMYLLKLRNIKNMLLVSLATSLGVYFAFSTILGIQLPSGLLDFFF